MIFDPEDWSDTFLRNVGSHTDHTAEYASRQPGQREHRILHRTSTFHSVFIFTSHCLDQNRSSNYNSATKNISVPKLLAAYSNIRYTGMGIYVQRITIDIRMVYRTNTILRTALLPWIKGEVHLQTPLPRKVAIALFLGAQEYKQKWSKGVLLLIIFFQNDKRVSALNSRR
jgi:hypothetical protein